MADNLKPRLHRSSVVEVGLTDDDKFLVRLKEEENLPWVDIADRFRTERGRNMQVVALQMRYKRIREKYRIWEDDDVKALKLAHEYWEKYKWEIVSSKMLDFGIIERWPTRLCSRKWQELESEIARGKPDPKPMGALWPPRPSELSRGETSASPKYPLDDLVDIPTTWSKLGQTWTGLEIPRQPDMSNTELLAHGYHDPTAFDPIALPYHLPVSPDANQPVAQGRFHSGHAQCPMANSPSERFVTPLASGSDTPSPLDFGPKSEAHQSTLHHPTHQALPNPYRASSLQTSKHPDPASSSDNAQHDLLLTSGIILENLLCGHVVLPNEFSNLFDTLYPGRLQPPAITREEYQHMLHVLECQNKRRLMAARLEQDRALDNNTVPKLPVVDATSSKLSNGEASTNRHVNDHVDPSSNLPTDLKHVSSTLPSSSPMIPNLSNPSVKEEARINSAACHPPVVKDSPTACRIRIVTDDKDVDVHSSWRTKVRDGAPTSRCPIVKDNSAPCRCHSTNDNSTTGDCPIVKNEFTSWQSPIVKDNSNFGSISGAKSPTGHGPFDKGNSSTSPCPVIKDNSAASYLRMIKENAATTTSYCPTVKNGQVTCTCPSVKDNDNTKYPDPPRHLYNSGHAIVPRAWKDLGNPSALPTDPLRPWYHGYNRGHAILPQASSGAAAQKAKAPTPVSGGVGRDDLSPGSGGKEQEIITSLLAEEVSAIRSIIDNDAVIVPRCRCPLDNDGSNKYPDPFKHQYNSGHAIPSRGAGSEDLLYPSYPYTPAPPEAKTKANKPKYPDLLMRAYDAAYTLSPRGWEDSFHPSPPLRPFGGEDKPNGKFSDPLKFRYNNNNAHHNACRPSSGSAAQRAKAKARARVPVPTPVPLPSEAARDLRLLSGEGSKGPSRETWGSKEFAEARKLRSKGVTTEGAAGGLAVHFVTGGEEGSESGSGSEDGSGSDEWVGSGSEEEEGVGGVGGEWDVLL